MKKTKDDDVTKWQRWTPGGTTGPGGQRRPLAGMMRVNQSEYKNTRKTASGGGNSKCKGPRQEQAWGHLGNPRRPVREGGDDATGRRAQTMRVLEAAMKRSNRKHDGDPSKGAHVP